MPHQFCSLSWGKQQPCWGAPLPHASYLCQDRLNSSNKGPKYPPASPPPISLGSIWLSALQESENSVLLCSISNKSLASKRLMVGHCYSGWEASAFPGVGEKRGAPAIRPQSPAHHQLLPASSGPTNANGFPPRNHRRTCPAQLDQQQRCSR